MSQNKILIIGSNATRIEVQGPPGSTGPTGQYLNETVVPAMAFLNAGHDIVLATPTGAKPFIDVASDSPAHFENEESKYHAAKTFYANHPSINPARTLRSILEEGLDNYAALFIPGGQGPVVDLMQDPDLGVILRDFHAKSKPTAMLCHGPIASLAALPHAPAFRQALLDGDTTKAKQLAQGWQYAGYQMTIFSNSEEKWVERDILHADMIWHVVDALELAGAHVTTTPQDFAPHIIVDRELITGQNPRSDHPIAAKLIEILSRQP